MLKENFEQGISNRRSKKLRHSTFLVRYSSVFFIVDTLNSTLSHYYEMKTTVSSTSSPNVVIGDPVAGNALDSR